MRKLVAVCLLLVLAGCTGPVADLNPFGHDRAPGEDPLGWENGYWYDDSLSVTAEDGLNASERAAVLARSKARVEQLRKQEFSGNVSVEVISRTEYRNQSGGPGGGGEDPWNDQVWEALLIVGEDSGTGEAFGETYNTSVQGYYSPASDNITIVSDSPTPTIDRTTLSHELVHALQDQYGNLGGTPDTQDRQLASQSVTEGEANYIQWTYEDRCENRWRCIPRPGSEGGGDGGSSGGTPDDGVFVTIYQPYATGPGLIDQQYRADGWSGVERLYENPPNSTEQVIHPDRYPDEEPINVTVPDRSSGEWKRFDHDPVADTVGEASIFAMLLTNDAISPEEWFRYRSEASAGWGGDSIVPYRNGSDGYGYVWASEWDSETDARQFERAYRSILDERASRQPGEDVYRLPDSDTFGDAFRVTRSGTRVRIVNAPTVSDLDEVHG